MTTSASGRPHPHLPALGTVVHTTRMHLTVRAVATTMAQHSACTSAPARIEHAIPAGGGLSKFPACLLAYGMNAASLHLSIQLSWQRTLHFDVRSVIRLPSSQLHWRSCQQGFRRDCVLELSFGPIPPLQLQ